MQVFAEDPTARSDFRPGMLYAVWGVADWIYYGQIAGDRSVAFFRRRDRAIAGSANIPVSPIMSRVTIFLPSIGQALRSGAWKKLGRYSLSNELESDRPVVQWPIGTLDVIVWTGRMRTRITRVEDPSVQALEVMAVLDAVDHVPGRLAVDYAPNEASHTIVNAWAIGGPVWRERRVKEEFARRFPDSRAHALPADWVPTRL